MVITRQPGFAAEGAEIAASADEALDLLGAEPEIMVIGGGEIYRLFWPMADRLYLTEVDLTVEGDTHLPGVAAADWREVARETHEKGPTDSAAFTLRVLDRSDEEKLSQANAMDNPALSSYIGAYLQPRHRTTGDMNAVEFRRRWR